MLFPYIYVPHQMERMQRFVNFIFYQVWCRAPKAEPFDLSLFDANPPLKEVMTSFAYDHTKAGDRFRVKFKPYTKVSLGSLDQKSHSSSGGIKAITNWRKCAPIMQQYISPVTPTSLSITKTLPIS